MVTRFGMSPELGNVDLASNHDKLSTATKQLVESEVRRLIEEGRIRATNLLQSKRKELEFLAKALVDYETLNREEAFKVIKGEKLEGKFIMPPGNIKIPDLGSPAVGALPDVPEIPGSAPAEGTGRKEPPVGGAVA
jgi:ATP-dependent metalloprotease